MKASLIFSSTSHSINVQKVGNLPVQARICADLVSDIQDRAIESVRPQVHDSRDRKHWRATSPLPGRLVAGPTSETPDRRNADEPV